MKMRGEGIHPPLSSLTKMNGTTTRKESGFTRDYETTGAVYAEMRLENIIQGGIHK